MGASVVGLFRVFSVVLSVYVRVVVELGVRGMVELVHDHVGVVSLVSVCWDCCSLTRMFLVVLFVPLSKVLAQDIQPVCVRITSIGLYLPC